MSDSKGAAIDELLDKFFIMRVATPDTPLEKIKRRNKVGKPAFELKQAILALLAQEVKRVRIDELERLSKSKWADLAYDIPFYLQERIAKLKEER